jgi:hypothetical protein
MESKAGGAAGDDEVVKEAVGGTTSCFGISSPDASIISDVTNDRRGLRG